MQSKATTVKDYLASLPAERRDAVQALRKVILANLGKGFEESMQYGMIGYSVPHSLYPAGYHCDPKQPLPFASLASQKNHMAFSLMSVYLDPQEERWFKAAWQKSGKKLDMGKACVRFKAAEDLALDVIGEVIRRMPAQRWIECCTALTQRPRKASAKSTGRAGGAKKPASRAARARSKA